MIAGHVGLFFEMWDAGIFGNDVSPGGSVFENKAHFTTAKAMLIISAEQYDFTGLSGDKTRMHQGWGMPDLQKLYDLREDIMVVDETDICGPFGVAEYIVTVDSGEPELKITMSYSDPPGNPAVQSQHRINDITLKAISPSGVEYWGNNGLLEGVWSEPDGEADTKNTVECIFVENPESGAWTIEVHADEIIQDCHVETPELDADYALVAAPVLSGPIPPAIDGPSEGDIGEEYEYTFMSEDPAGEDLYYWIDWDDSTYEEWIGPYTTGEVITVAHTWNAKDNFSILAKAKNALDVEGGFSSPYYVNIFASKIDMGLIKGGLFVASVTIHNVGEADAHDVDWNLSLEGGFIFWGKESSGTIDIIPAGESVNVSSGIIIGFGQTQYTATASEPYGSSDFRNQGGRVFAIFIHVNPGGG